MTLHISIKDVLERCKNTESPLAIFKADKGNYKFNVVFANSSQTQIDIKKNRGFICLFNPNDKLEELEHNLKQSVGV